MSDDLPDNPLGEAILHASRDEIEALQLRRLSWTLARVWREVPHYRAAFEAAGVHPDDFRGLDDLARFPFTMKEDFRATYPLGLLAVPRERVVRLHASSGTTGKPTVVAYTQADIDVWADAVARSIRAAGGRPSDMVHIAYGYGLFTGGLGAHYGAERLGCTVVPVSGGQTARQVRLILDLAPDIIMATPSYLLVIADALRAEGVDPLRTSLRIGILGAEPWSEDMRREIEATFDLAALDIYGLSEVIGPGVAQEFAAGRDGLTLWEDLFYPEIVDPETGEVLPEGERGELVLTTLAKEAMPVVRYRTRDLTRLLPGTACSMRRMDRVLGRSDDMLIIHGVNVFPTQLEALICGEPRLAPHYEIELSREGRLDRLALLVESRPETAAEEMRTAAAADLRHRIKAMIGITAEVRVLEPGSLTRSTGKAVRIRDLRR